MKMAFRRGGIFALQADKVGRLERDPDQTESLLLEVSLPKRWYFRRLDPFQYAEARLAPWYLVN
jgi:hypothetical protein